MISTLAMPVAPESPSSQHNAPAPADQCAHHPPLPGDHQRTGSGNVLLSELAAAASAASRGVVLPPLRSLIHSDTPPPSSVPHAPSATAAAPASDAANPQPSFAAAPGPQLAGAPTHAEREEDASGPKERPYAGPPIIELSQAPPSLQPSRSNNAMALQRALNATPPVLPLAPKPAPPSVASQTAPAPVPERLQAPAHIAANAADAPLPGLRVPSPSRSSVSSVGSHESAVSPVTPTAAAPPTPSAHASMSSENLSNQYAVSQASQQQAGPQQAGPQHTGQKQPHSQPASQQPIAPRPASAPKLVQLQPQQPQQPQQPPQPQQPQQQLAPGTGVVGQLPPGAAMNHHRVLAPAPARSPLVPSPHAPPAAMAQPAHQPHPQHLHHGMVPGPQPAIAPRGMPPAAVPGPQPALHPQGAPHQIVYVNPYGYSVDSLPYMYPASAVPHPHYGYAPQPAGYPSGAPMPMMHMPQQQVPHPSLAQVPPAAPGNPVMQNAAAVGGGAPMDMKPGMAVPPHMMQPWAHTFSQEIKRRTRTGCLTCRRRRVKCDEQHPQCRNCLKSERVCLGYDVIFSFDRAKRVDHLMHRRRLYRAARDSRARVARDVAVNPVKDEAAAAAGTASEPADAGATTGDNAAAAAAPSEQDDEERIVLRSWSKVVELFRSRLAGVLDVLLGSDMFVNIARRTGDYLNATDQRFVNVAGELEAMRQLLAVVYPSLGFEGLNILESQIALEKLRTTEDYCLLRGVAECLTSEEPGASMQEMISPTAAVRRTIHQQHLQRIYMRLAFLHRVLHPDRNQNVAAAHIESAEALNRAAETALSARPGDQRSEVTDVLWTFVEDAIIGASGAAPSNSDETLKLESVPAVVKLAEQNDGRGVLALLALYARRPAEGELHEVLNSLSLQGLPMALLEIGMASRSQ